MNKPKNPIQFPHRGFIFGLIAMIDVNITLMLFLLLALLHINVFSVMIAVLCLGMAIFANIYAIKVINNIKWRTL